MDIYVENITLFAVILFFVLVVLKNITEVKKNVRTKVSWLLLLPSLIFLLMVLPIIPIFLLIFFLYRQIVRSVLKVKHGSKFGGLVEGSDAVHTMEGPETSVIKVLLIFEYHHQQQPQEFFETLKDTVHTLLFCNKGRLPKFHSSFLSSMGYTYILKENITVDDCVRKMKIVDCQNGEMNTTELLKLLGECYNMPLPKNESILWDMLVSTQTMKWKKNTPNGVKYYPVLGRIHHGVADGVALLKLLAGVFADHKNVKLVSSKLYHEESHVKSHNYKNNDNNLSVKNFTEELITLGNYGLNILKFIAITLYVILLTPSSLFVNLGVKAKDRNILHGPRLSGNKILGLNIEESPEYIQKVKRIKNKLPKTSFSDIIFTALSASLTDHFQKNSTSYPEYLTAAIPMLPGSEELQNIVPGELNINDLNLQNGYSLLLLNFPLFIKKRCTGDGKGSLIERLRLLKRETHLMKTSVDYHVNRLLMSVIFAILPQPLVRFILGASHCTTVISILPGPPKLSYGGGVLPVSDFGFWVPHLKNTGVSFSVMTYDQRLHIGISVDEALIPRQEDAQSIVDGVYKYLDLLEDESENIH